MRVANNKAYRTMQSLHANYMVIAKAAASGCVHVNVEEIWRVQLSQNFYFFLFLYHSCKLIQI